jgi:hypothetical protein
MNTIQVKDINLGGIADSKYQGQKNSVAEMVGFDIHGEPGIMRHNQKLTKESGVLIDDLCKTILPCSDGYTYLFGSTTGKIWSRSSSGVYAYVGVVAPAAGALGVLDADEYEGYIYYSMQSRLGRVAVGAPTNWATRDDSWQTFTNTDADFHPFKQVNQVLFVGDGKYLAQVDAGVFSANALDLAAPFRIKSLGKILTDILMGTFVNAYRVATEIFRWNTWSIDSYQSSDDIPEIGINCFLRTDNLVLVNAGTKGNFYYYNGSQLENYKRIPGSWIGTNEATLHPNAACNMFGLPLFGLSNKSGNPAKQGIYSLGGYDRNYPKVINLEWLISNGRYNGVDIGAIEMCGTQLLVAWKNSDTITMTIANPGVVTWTTHGQTNGTPIMFTTTGALPTGITASTYYYLRVIDANTFHLYDTYAHAIDTLNTTGRITITGTQSGVHTCANYGIDYLDATAKVAQAYFSTRVVNVARNDSKTLSGYVAYRSLPTDSSIKVYHKVNYAAVWTESTCVVDTIRKTVYLKEAMPEANAIEIKVESNASSTSVNEAPEIEMAEFLFE